MAQVAHTGLLTPADELRDLLSRNENRAANVRGAGASVVQLLKDMDRIAVLWPELEAHGVDLQPEAGRWETIQKTVRRKAPQILREINAAGGMAGARHQADGAASDAWWWALDRVVRDAKRRRVIRAGVILGVIALAVAGISFLARLLFPVDPALRESLLAQDKGDRLYEQNDVVGALTEYRHAADVRPDDPDAWLRIGAVLEQQGDRQGADEAFRTAETLIGDPARYHVSRGASYLALNLLERAEPELKQAVAAGPDDPYAWYYLATVYELTQRTGDAIAALEKSAALAEQTNDAELIAMARYRVGMLMQRQDFPTIPPTP